MFTKLSQPQKICSRELGEIAIRTAHLITFSLHLVLVFDRCAKPMSMNLSIYQKSDLEQKNIIREHVLVRLRDEINWKTFTVQSSSKCL